MESSSSWLSFLQYALFVAVVVLLVKPVGWYLERVFSQKKTFLDFALSPVEKLIYKLTGVNADEEMDWKQYAVSFVLFTCAGIFTLFIILLVQSFLPFYDAAFLTTPMTLDLAFNVAVSFATTTTWQSYGGETTMSYFSQVVGLTV